MPFPLMTPLPNPLSYRTPSRPPSGYDHISLSSFKQGAGCDATVCKGSLLATPYKRPPGEPRPLEEVRSHAKDFIDQYYTSIKR